MITDEEVQEISNRVASGANDKLSEICETLAYKHNIDKVTLSQEDTRRIGVYLYEVQSQSFTLGVQMGLKMVQEYMEAHKRDNTPTPLPPTG